MEFDPFSPEWFEDPYPIYDRLLENAPVYRNEKRNFWAISKYHDVANAFRDWKTFSSAQGVMLDQLNTPGFQGNENVPGFIVVYDPPFHTRLRALVNRTLTPRAVLVFEDAIRRLVTEALDDLEGREEFDFVKDFAERFPAELTMEMLDVPAADRAHIREVVERFYDVSDADETGRSLNSLQAMMETSTYLMELTAERRTSPGSDMLSQLITSETVDEDGVQRSLSDVEVANFGVLLIDAGLDTTAKLVTSAIVQFHRHPEAWEKIRTDPGLIPGAMIETGRFNPPGQYLGRKLTRDVTIHGVTIPADSNVLLVVGAANRDPDVFENPSVWDIERQSEHPPLTFGNGPHFCLGQNLAKLEARIAFEELTRRWERFEVDEAGLVKTISPVVAGYAVAPIRVQRAVTVA